MASAVENPIALAESFLGQGDLASAWTWARRAIVLAPHEPAAHNLFGIIALTVSDSDSALVVFSRALAPDPFNAYVLGNVAIAHGRVGVVGPAIRIARHAIALSPSDAPTHNAIAWALQGAGYLAESLAIFRRSLAIRPDPVIHSNLLFAMSYGDDVSSDRLFAEYRRWERLHARPHYGSAPLHGNDRDPDRPLVVGYLSQDFLDHPLGRILAALFENHDPSVVRVCGYASIRRTDAVTERCRRASAAWRLASGLTDDDLAARIRADRVDILVVVGAHSAHNRLLVAARRPAPIAISLDDVSTSGMDAIDYWITDPLIHPVDGSGATERFSEQLLRLPCFFLHPSYDVAPAVAPPPAAASGRITFGSFGNPTKLTPTTIAAWAQALRAVPDSRLMLKYMTWYGDPVVQARVAGMLAAHGIDPARIEFVAGEAGRDQHLARWNEVDIALDSYPFGGWTSTFEAMWMGVPVISLIGERFAGRTGLSVLEHTGLQDLAVHRPEDFGRVAASLASDLPRLTAARRSLREKLRASPLCDGKTQARYFETAYREVWRRWCAAR